MTGVLVAFLPWLAIFTWQFSSVQRAFWIPSRRGRRLGAAAAYAGSATLLWILGPLAGLGVAVMWRARRRTDAVASRPIAIVLPWLLGPIVLPFLLSRVSSPIFLEKYTIAASVPFAILAAEGLAALPMRSLRTLCLAGIVLLSVVPSGKYYGTIAQGQLARGRAGHRTAGTAG